MYNLVTDLKPVTKVIQDVSSDVKKVMPQIAAEMEQMSMVANDTLLQSSVDFSQPALDLAFSTTSRESEEILKEVSDLVEGNLKNSIPGAVAYILQGDTTIAYTGDYRIHGAAAEETRRFTSAARDATVLITEGTRVGREADEEVSEGDVLRNCLSATEDAGGLVVADFSAHNFERLETFKEIAARTGRTLTVTAKDAYILHALGCADGTCMMDEDPIGIYSELKSRERIKWESEVVEKRWGARYIDPLSIRRSPEKHLLCLSFFDLKHLLDIKPDGGVYIYSSSEAHSEEQEFDFQRLSQWLRLFSLTSVGFKMAGDPPKPEFVKGFHASGHLSQNDLVKIIEEIDPDKIIPIHTQHPEWFRATFPKTVTIPSDGRVNL